MGRYKKKSSGCGLYIFITVTIFCSFSRCSKDWEPSRSTFDHLSTPMIISTVMIRSPMGVPIISPTETRPFESETIPKVTYPMNTPVTVKRTITPRPIFTMMTKNSSSTAIRIKELTPNSQGFSEKQLIDSGRIGIRQADGSLFFSGFYLLPSGNFYPLNEIVLKGDTTEDRLINSVSLDPGVTILEPTRRPTSVSTRGPTPYIPQNLSCNPNYSVCLPIVGDLNCPDIAYKNFYVIGYDEYRLDRDKDGIACEK